MSEPEQNEIDVLICVPADKPLAVAGATFDKRCNRCGQRVMLAPSGQRLLARKPNVEICCLECFSPEPGDEVHAAADSETLAAELRTAGPNPWRRRN